VLRLHYVTAIDRKLVLAVQRIVEACNTERIPRACVCIVISDQAANSSPFNGISFSNETFPIVHLPLLADVYDDWGATWRDYEEDVTRIIIRERLDIIIQVSWTLKLGQPFVDAMALPRILPDILWTHPVPLGWIRPALPGVFPGDLRHAIPWAYDAFQRGEITEAGYSVMRWKRGTFELTYAHEVPMWKEEPFDQFAARMLDIECELAIEIGRQGLKDVAPISVSTRRTFPVRSVVMHSRYAFSSVKTHCEPREWIKTYDA
jgi:folate-dependent phosphoribosylglycinamide formyltransferase PurN